MSDEIQKLKQKMRLSLPEYSERLKELETIREKVNYGGVEPDDVRRLCDLSYQALLNSQIVVLDRVYPKLDIFPGLCPSCSKPIWVMTLGQGIAWVCGACGTASTRNHRKPQITGEAVSKEEGPDIAEKILLGLQRKKKTQ